MEDIRIKLIEPILAKEVCQSLTATLPEWFGITEANERYAQGMLDRISFVACLDNNYIGMITLEFPFSNNANIYWMAVKKSHHGKQVGKKLLQTVENYCYERGYSSLTVETLSPKQQDENYLKTYNFYAKLGFQPLFEMNTYDPHNLMLYMQKTISLGEFKFIDLTHSLSSKIPNWNPDCGFQHKIISDYSNCINSEINPGRDITRFRVQTLEMFAGIGTHIDAPSHCISGASNVSELSLDSLIVPCRVINVSDKAHEQYKLTIDDIKAYEDEYGIIPKNTFIIVYTGWDQWWDTPTKYRNNLIFPSVSKPAAELLLKREIVGLGIDTLSPDTTNSGFPVHQLLLGAGKYIIENIANAKELGERGFIIALPIKIDDGTEAPIRLVGMRNRCNMAWS